MPGYGRYVRDVPAHLKHPGNAFVAQVVKVQILDFKELTGPGERRRDSGGRSWENLQARLRH